MSVVLAANQQPCGLTYLTHILSMGQRNTFTLWTLNLPQNKKQDNKIKKSLRDLRVSDSLTDFTHSLQYVKPRSYMIENQYETFLDLFVKSCVEEFNHLSNHFFQLGRKSEVKQKLLIPHAKKWVNMSHVYPKPAPIVNRGKKKYECTIARAATTQ